MVKRDKEHLIFKASEKDLGYSAPRFPIKEEDKPKRPERQLNHFEALRKQVDDIFTSEKPINIPVKISGIKGDNLEELILNSLDSKTNGKRLLSVKETDDYTIANVQFADKKSVEKFKNSLHNEKKNKLSALCETIEDIGESNFDSLLTDNNLPDDYSKDKSYWFELWLINDEDKDQFEELLSYFQEELTDKEIFYEKESLRLGDRLIAMVNCNENILNKIIGDFFYIAEIRFAKKIKNILDSDVIEQKIVLDDIKNRLMIKENSNTISILLDTGTNRHPLLEPFLQDRNYTIDDNYGTDDLSYVAKHGHGTRMSGVCLYGDISELINKADKIDVIHKISSVKIHPKIEDANSHKELAKSVEKAIKVISKKIDKNIGKNYVLATTTYYETDIPTANSIFLDRESFYSKRLFLVSIGNCDIEFNSNTQQHKEKQNNSCIRDPAHAWNVLSIGSYTKKDDSSNLKDGCRPFAKCDNISPYSLCSKNNFPIKPDVLFEGGNAVIHTDEIIDYDENLELISTSPSFHSRIAPKLFESFSMTSASTALAARFASILMEDYQSLWPETIRGLIVHSAEYTNAMMKNFTKSDKLKFLQKYGFGVPNLDRARRSASNSLTLIAQEEFNLFEFKQKPEVDENGMPILYKVGKNKGQQKTKEVKKQNFVVFKLPFPKETLQSLLNKRVKLKITLSYFIEPRSGYRGGRDKWTYQSFGLNFDVQKSTDLRGQFLARINTEMREDGIDYQNEESVGWFLGKKFRNGRKGSVVKDILEARASDLANMEHIAVYPVGGWWKEVKRQNENNKVRFSLIVDIETQEEGVDLYTEIKIKIENMIKTNIEISSGV